MAKAKRVRKGTKTGRVRPLTEGMSLEQHADFQEYARKALGMTVEQVEELSDRCDQVRTEDELAPKA